jgi:hypothetical protein
VRATGSHRAATLFSLLARAAGVARPTATWRYVAGRTYDNSIGELVLDEDGARVTIFRATPAERSAASLERSSSSELHVRSSASPART